MAEGEAVHDGLSARRLGADHALLAPLIDGPAARSENAGLDACSDIPAPGRCHALTN